MREDNGIGSDGGGGSAALGATEVCALGAPSPVAQPAGRARGCSLAQMLGGGGILSSGQVNRAQEEARRERRPLGQILVRDDLVASRVLATLTALHLGLTMVELRAETIDRAAVRLVPEDVARKYMVLALSQKDGHLTVAMVDPTDLQLLQDLAARTGRIIDPVVTTGEDIQEHIDLYYRLSEALESTDVDEDGQPNERVTSRKVREAGPAQVINLLLRQALQDRASDIHIEPAEERLRIRFRIDGILHEVMNLPMDMHATIISRLKIECGMNIAERRRPQDGQLNFEAHGREIDVRVAVSGTVTGEMAVLRLLDNAKFTLLGLEQLGFDEESQEQYRKLLKLPYGMIIVCGPTGSGKSTTLYASLMQMNRVENKMISIEDPVEYHMADVNQMQVHNDAGITFATQLRSILRLDPDVILIGEIRDQETAIIATQAALTGHLVLTSLHANDTVSALIRLRDLGVPPYLIVSSVAGLVAQRMVRRVCSTCGALTSRPLAEQQVFAEEMGRTRERFYYGAGCNACAQTGYLGRTGVFEIMAMTDAIRQLFMEDAPRYKLWEQALKDGMTYLRRDGMEKVDAGITTPYEVMRVLFTLE